MPNQPESPHKRRRWIAWSAGVILSVGLFEGSFVLHRYTQSDAFCGQTCHRAMAPQNAAHRAGTHATVPCVGCHVDRGALAQVRAKIRGVEHLWAELRNDYARPIRVTSTQHRVPDERCSACHPLTELPRAKRRQVPRYLYDETNSAWQVSFTLRIVDGHIPSDPNRGIAWHMSNPSQVRFATADPAAQSIPWVRVRRADGSETTYVSRTSAVNGEDLTRAPQRDMTCSDCHNRAGHDLVHLDSSLDRALYNGQVSTSLPSIKRHLVQTLAAGHTSREEAVAAIRGVLNPLVRRPDPTLQRLSRSEADGAASHAGTLYADSVFPESNVGWDTYPSHLEHRFSSGCFRCHDGEHIDAAGKAIPNDCETTCHTAPRMSPIAKSLVLLDAESTPWHPWQLPILDFGIAAHDRLACSDCHAAGVVPKLACEDCHHPPDL